MKEKASRRLRFDFKGFYDVKFRRKEYRISCYSIQQIIAHIK